MQSNMIRIAAAALVLAAGGAYGAEPVAAVPATVEVIGLQIATKGFDYDEEWNRYKEMPFNMQQPGIEVALALTFPQGGIIELDEKQSQVKAFMDNQRTDLLAAGEDVKFGNEPGLGSFPKVVQDGKGLLFTVKSPVLPAAGAQMVAVAGSLALQTGTEQVTAEAEGVAIEAGAKVTLDDYAFEITEVDEPDWGDAAAAVTLETSVGLDAVIGFSFHGADGTEIESDSAGSSTMSFGSAVTASKTLNLMEAPDGPVTIRMTYWKDLNTVTVPFKVKTGLVP